MAKVQYKGLLVLAFIFLSFSSTSSAARRLRAGVKGDENSLAGDGFDGVVLPKGSPDHQVTKEVEELLSMDYTPAGKKPPIHN
ncbi:hypothetical protein CDL15_Pgr017307 [Punica granatum]|uniref:Root meristem growth factor 9-like n=1 Tax=Punica granatum TaxID=22663 RepID=A0A218Y3I4_PUNGR|nr:hypothetical protein CDL15_Pgr017307 [Punica granatum]PKI79331.1 hypothetical protein CRG98_000276 [Punica granatum]